MPIAANSYPPGMEVIGVAGEFNAQIITTFGIITANQLSVPISPSELSGLSGIEIDLNFHTQWLGRYPPLEWPLRQYYREKRRNGTGQNLQSIFSICQEETFSGAGLRCFRCYQPYERFFKGFVFHLSDGSMEGVNTRATHQDILMSPTHYVEFAVEQNETITDMVLDCAHETIINSDKAKLSGLQMHGNG
ncbi:hypothetical protein N7519_003355 [Penicillium mononematosum]|uniref:uncharacterized protein n=1 Tax=Penicillium mononematosum TaxID=268346 RepID=UPI00254775D6|nr:uncharacterized protein N7519_003355 [Penicillium mononematosum]KAJ6188447.1 hypothetical protein N7519_003355 [Penicillium mononematosum]